MKSNAIFNIGLEVMLAASLQACNGDNYTVTGNIAGHGGRILLLQPVSESETDTIANYVSPDGSFSFTGRVSAPVEARLEAADTRLAIPLFLEDGADITVTADVETDDWTTAGGGALQQLRNEWRAHELEAAAARDSIENYYRTNYDMSDYFWVVQARGALERYAEECDSVENAFIAANDNMVAASIIYNRRNVLTRNKTIAGKYNLLGENARGSVSGKLLAPIAERIANVTVGGTAPDFTMETPDGEPISLYGVKGKVKILDFWASWCGPCRAENPNVKRIYEKYHDKGLEILSVSLDTDKDKWIEAIKADGMSWKHASELGKANTARDIYNVHGIPFMLILDENNRIISEGLRGERLEEFIAAQFTE